MVFLEGLVSREPCEQCGAEISTIAPVLNCPTCSTKYLITLISLSRQSIQPSDIIILVYDHYTNDIVELTVRT